MLRVMLVEDNLKLQAALKTGLEALGEATIISGFASGEEALRTCLEGECPQAILMDVALAGRMNGIEAAVAIRREFPRMPVVFYSIQDDDSYFRAFR
jgi:DNA-binding NarL/FixJ family response regulator